MFVLNKDLVNQYCNVNVTRNEIEIIVFVFSTARLGANAVLVQYITKRTLNAEGACKALA